MNIVYSTTNGYCGSNSPIFFLGDPDAFRRTIEAEARLKDRYSKDPQQAPSPQRGDIYILIGTLLGIIIGGAAGATVGSHYFGFAGFFFGLIGGVIIGGTIGASIGSYVKKRRQTTRNKAQKPF